MQFLPQIVMFEGSKHVKLIVVRWLYQRNWRSGYLEIWSKLRVMATIETEMRLITAAKNLRNIL